MVALQTWCFAAILLVCAEASVTNFLYAEGQHDVEDTLEVYANSLTSTDGIVPYPFYHLNFCRPTEAVREEPETNLGMTLRGDHIMNSPYKFKVMEEKKCQPLCTRALDYNDVAKFESLILKRYRGNLILDNLPVVRREGDIDESDKACRIDSARLSDIRGFAIGGCRTSLAGDVRVHIYNHLNFTVQYNTRVEKDASGKTSVRYFVVGFLVEPLSYGDSGCRGLTEKKVISGRSKDKGLPPLQVDFTYSVTWEKKDYDWGMRWEYYLKSKYISDNDTQMHWQKIMLSLLIILCMTGVVAIILMRTLHLDFNRYNNPDNEDEMQEEVGWKLVHTDVFRPPSHPNLFAAVIGMGTQILGMSVCILCFALMGLLSPSKRGRMLMTMIFLFVLMAFVNGYVTGSIQMMFSTRQWKSVIFAGTAFPALLFTMWAITEVFLNSRQAANAVDMQTVMSIIALWFGVCLPQAVLGASFAYRQKPITNPLRYQSQARAIPPQRWMFSLPATLLLPGLIPYAAAHWELELLMRSIWQGQILHLYLFLALVFVAVLVTISETVLVTIYYQLVFEDYRWWWKSVLIPSGMGVYYLLFAAHYYFEVLQVKSYLATWIYCCFCTGMTLSIVLSAGAIGFLASWLFIRTIYTAIKIE